MRAPVERTPANLLGRHVLELALEELAFGLVNPLARLRDAEIGDAHRPVEQHEKILWRHVTMDDVERFTLIGGE